LKELGALGGEKRETLELSQRKALPLKKNNFDCTPDGSKGGGEGGGKTTAVKSKARQPAIFTGGKNPHFADLSLVGDRVEAFQHMTRPILARKPEGWDVRSSSFEGVWTAAAG